jgi:hypothetical protein
MRSSTCCAQLRVGHVRNTADLLATADVIGKGVTPLTN